MPPISQERAVAKLIEIQTAHAVLPNVSTTQWQRAFACCRVSVPVSWWQANRQTRADGESLQQPPPEHSQQPPVERARRKTAQPLSLLGLQQVQRRALAYELQLQAMRRRHPWPWPLCPAQPRARRSLTQRAWAAGRTLAAPCHQRQEHHPVQGAP